MNTRMMFERVVAEANTIRLMAEVFDFASSNVI